MTGERACDVQPMGAAASLGELRAYEDYTMASSAVCLSCPPFHLVPDLAAHPLIAQYSHERSRDAKLAEMLCVSAQLKIHSSYESARESTSLISQALAV